MGSAAAAASALRFDVGPARGRWGVNNRRRGSLAKTGGTRSAPRADCGAACSPLRDARRRIARSRAAARQRRTGAHTDARSAAASRGGGRHRARQLRGGGGGGNDGRRRGAATNGDWRRRRRRRARRSPRARRWARGAPSSSPTRTAPSRKALVSILRRRPGVAGVARPLRRRLQPPHEEACPAW